MSTITDSVLGRIDKEEIADLALALGSIYSPPGQEREVAELVKEWLRKAGFETKVICLTPDRPNVVGVYKGTGGGYSLAYNSHMDVAPAMPEFVKDASNPIRRGAWREKDILYGTGIVNDKGPMACFLCAAKAIKEAGVALKGDLVLTAVSGEVGWEPVDEFAPPLYLSKEVGTRYMVSHGTVTDYALVAEATNFCLAWIEAGKAFFKITVFGDSSRYTPYINRPYDPEKNPNAIVRMARVIEKIEEWAWSYEIKNTYVCPGGTLIPKVNIGAVRGGAPARITVTSEVCSIYVDCRTVPNQDVTALQAELEGILRALHMEGKVELFVFRRGYEAQNINRLADTVRNAHLKIFSEEPKPAIGPYCSMWRDINVFNELGIPALTYGPAPRPGVYGNTGITIDDLHKAAEVYAMVALDLCTQNKSI